MPAAIIWIHTLAVYETLPLHSLVRYVNVSQFMMMLLYYADDDNNNILKSERTQLLNTIKKISTFHSSLLSLKPHSRIRPVATYNNYMYLDNNNKQLKVHHIQWCTQTRNLKWFEWCDQAK